MTVFGPHHRLVIIHNPHSSRSKLVKRAVFDRLDGAGYSYTTLEVAQASLADNIARLKSHIQSGDIILSAAGDGSAHAIMNTVIASKQPHVTLGFLAFGNFNDLPHAFNSRRTMQDPVAFLKKATTIDTFPLLVSADDVPLRSSLLYTTVGWTAAAAAYFDEPQVRGRSSQGKTGLVRSLLQLSRFYFASRKKSQLPPFRIDGTAMKRTDILVANSTKIARLFSTGDRYYLTPTFLVRTLDVRRLLHNSWFLLSGILWHFRGQRREGLVVDFDKQSDIIVQCDGEVVRLSDCKQLSITKSSHPLTILTSK